MTISQPGYGGHKKAAIAQQISGTCKNALLMDSKCLKMLATWSMCKYLYVMNPVAQNSPQGRVLSNLQQPYCNVTMVTEQIPYKVLDGWYCITTRSPFKGHCCCNSLIVTWRSYLLQNSTMNERNIPKEKTSSIFTARKRSLRRLCFYTCLSVDSGGSTWQVPPGYVHPLLDRYTPSWQVHPPGQVHSRAGTPPGQVYPPEQCMLGDTGNKWVVHILLECILV